MEKNNLVSVVIPTYNREQFIANLLDSVIAQSHSNWECIVIDDGSNDDTLDVLANYSNKDSRISFFHRPIKNLKGANACRNYGLKKSKGEYVIWFDSDDIMLPGLLEEQVKSIQTSQANYSICKSKWVTINGKEVDGFRVGKIQSNNPINDYIRFKAFWPINSVIYRKTFIVENQLHFDESLQQSQEYDFHVKVMQKDINYAVLDMVLVKVIATDDSISYSSKNSFTKAYSSLRVRQRFIANPDLHLDYRTYVFLLHDMHRIFMQQTMAGNKKGSLMAAYYYLRSHFYHKEIFRKFFFKHFFPVLSVSITYNLCKKGYILLKKSNTFNYSS